MAHKMRKPMRVNRVQNIVRTLIPRLRKPQRVFRSPLTILRSWLVQPAIMRHWNYSSRPAPYRRRT